MCFLKLDTSKFNRSRNLSHRHITALIQEMFILCSGQYWSEWSINNGGILSVLITQHSSISAKVNIDAVSSVPYTVKAQLSLHGFDDSNGASHCLCAFSQSLTIAGQASSRPGGRCSFVLQICNLWCHRKFYVRSCHPVAEVVASPMSSWPGVCFCLQSVKRYWEILTCLCWETTAWYNSGIYLGDCANGLIFIKTIRTISI